MGSTRTAHLVQLIEIPQNDSVVSQVRKQLLPHLPPPHLLLTPAQLLTLGIRRALPVIATEECISGEDDVFGVYPFVSVITIILIDHLVFQINVLPPRP